MLTMIAVTIVVIALLAGLYLHFTGRRASLLERARTQLEEEFQDLQTRDREARDGFIHALGDGRPPEQALLDYQRQRPELPGTSRRSAGWDWDHGDLRKTKEEAWETKAGTVSQACMRQGLFAGLFVLVTGAVICCVLWAFEQPRRVNDPLPTASASGVSLPAGSTGPSNRPARPDAPVDVDDAPGMGKSPGRDSADPDGK